MLVAAGRPKKLDGDLLKLAWPPAVEHMLTMALMWVDSIIVNRGLGTASFAAVQLSGQIVNLIGMILMIVATGVSVVISHQVGAQEHRGAEKTAAQSIGLGVLVSIGLGGLLYATSPVLLRLVGAVDGVHSQGLVFLRIQALFLTSQAMLTLLGAVLRAVGNTRWPMWATLLVNLVNAGLNLFLVIGTPSFAIGGLHIPGLGGGYGLFGSSMATAVARTLGAMLLWYLLVRYSALSFRLKDCFRFEALTIHRVVRIGLPTALEFISYQGSQFVISMIVAPLGTALVAARGITFHSESFVYAPAVGMRVAAGVLVGQRMGAQSRDDAVASAQRAIAYGVTGVTVLAALLFLFPDTIVGIFTTDPLVVAPAVVALRIAALYKPGQCVNIVCAGIYSGAGNPQWPTALTTMSTWLITVPVAFLAVRSGYGLAGVFWAMFLDEMLRGLVNLWYFTTPHWRFRRV